MIKFKYRYCKVHIAGYLRGDLSDVARRRIARFIDECQDCYREYIRQAEFANRLERELPLLGRPDAQRLDTLWTSIQTELAAPEGALPARRAGKARSHLSLSHGLVMLAISIALLIPMVLGWHTSVAALDLPPRPRTAQIIRTAAPGAYSLPLAFASTRSGMSRRQPLLQNTPAASWRR